MVENRERRDKKIIILVKKGLSYRVIGKMFGLSHERIRQVYLKSYPQIQKGKS